jgi:hypothetical protein
VQLKISNRNSEHPAFIIGNMITGIIGCEGFKNSKHLLDLLRLEIISEQV